jgi:hypothetical protein
MPASRKKGFESPKNSSGVERLATIHSNDAGEDDRGSSDSDSDSAKNGECDSDCQDFDEREQQDIYLEMLY